MMGNQQKQKLNDLVLFSKSLTFKFGIVFMEQSFTNGTRLLGEYYTLYGLLHTIVITALFENVEIAIYDNMRRLVFNKVLTYAGLKKATSVDNFIFRSMHSAYEDGKIIRNRGV